MGNVFADPILRAYALSIVVLCLLMAGLGGITAFTRFKRQQVLNREDAGVNGGAQVVEVEHPDVARAKRAHANLIESLVPFIILGLLFFLTGPSKNFARALFTIFVVARLAHAVFYLRAIQPFRTMAFAVGAVVNLVMLVQVLRAILKA